MRIHVLGSAAGGGFPQWNCNCANCRGVRAGSIRATPRTQSSIAVSGNGQDWLLLNASPDIRAQLEAFPALQPARTRRDTAIGAILLVDAQIDHATGLLLLREHTAPWDLYCTAAVKEDLSTGFPIFNILSHFRGVNWHEVGTDELEFTMPQVPGLAFTGVPLKSEAPPYSPHRHNTVPGDNIGVRIRDLAGGGTLFYAPGLGEVDARIEAYMQDADCVLVDGTLWTDDEMIRGGFSSKRGAEMGHLDQSGEGGILQLLGRLERPRKILIHINNTNPILDEDSAQRAQLTEAGIEVAVDGMEIEL
ncbi:MAG: pyrroloquinoline quinone biosynthesis protein PqqB [Chromatiaceae bacterium]|nr:pyrroloquinoline quinone biosynthesis protein PqqB [Chromatiaceae bacterium]MCP5314220.1 pyrroloquinoline quinone biosynthesis protein PqqB [Chromatiaceae bacterium]